MDESRRSSATVVAYLGLIGVVAWLAWRIAPGRAAGVTGNDPATYVQMAYDLAQRGAVLHTFPGMAEAESLGAHPALLAPAGYLPRGENRLLALPLYPVGWPLLLALGYLAAGDFGLYLVLPTVALLAALVTWRLGRALLPLVAPRPWAAAGAAFALALLLTVREQRAYALAVMSDVPVQALAVLSLWLAWRAARQRRPAFALGAGLALGYGYLIRHTLALVALPVLWMIWAAGRREGRLSKTIWLLVGLTPLLLPDLLYNRLYLGGWLAPESPASLTFDPALIGPTLDELVNRPVSFGWSFALFWLGLPLLVIHRQGRRAFIPLLLWVVGYVGFHAGLAFTAEFGNVVRYNLPALPGVAIIAAAPLAWLGSQVERRVGRAGPILRPAALWSLGLIAPALLLRSQPDAHFIAYGFLDADARAAYAAVGEALPPDAVIVTDDQHAGALALYTDLAVARAQYWPPAEQAAFLNGMSQAGRPVCTLGTPAYPIDFMLAYGALPTGVRLAHPPDGSDGIVHCLPG